MHDFNKCQLQIKLEFESIGSKTMNVDINGYPVIPSEVDGKLLSVTNLNIILPTKVLITFSNKDPNHDTIVDQTGNIIQDLCVKIKSIALDGFKFNEKYLHQKLSVVTENGNSITTSYIGFNGQMLLTFDKSDVFSQYLWLNQ
jgi:hypothetical protein